MTRSRIAALAGVVALLAAAPAAAQSTGQVVLFGSGGVARAVTSQMIPITLTGRLIVQFQGSAAAGCAGLGVCGYSGTVQWQPPATGFLNLVRTAGRPYSVDLFLQGNAGFGGQPGGVTSATVSLLPAPPAASTCTDSSRTASGLSLAVRRGRVSFGLADARPGVLSSRCAGPRDADVIPRLAAPSVAVGALAAGHATISLGASRTFVSPGFTDHVRSTLAFHLGRPGRVTSQAGSRRNLRRYRELRLSYRARLTGAVTESATADGILGVCEPLGACGLTGVTTVAPRIPAARGYVEVVAPATRPERDLLAAVGLSATGNTRGVTVFGGAVWATGGTARTVTHQGTVTCTDGEPLGAGGLSFVTSGHRTATLYIPLPFGGGPVSRCPGPEASSQSLGAAAGVIPTTRLGQRSITVAIDRPAQRQSDYGFSVRLASRLTLRLTRTGLRSLTVSAPKGIF